VIASPFALLIDATTYLYRAYFRVRSLIARDGSQVNAVYGLSQTLLSLLEERRPAYAAAAFDDPNSPTFRQKLFPAYKRGRAAVPDRLLPQFALAQDVASAFGFLTLHTPGFEADDLIATTVRQMRSHGVACVVVGEDKDLAQLVGPGVWLRRLEAGDLLDEAAVQERYGVPPARIPDLLALAGDPVDGIPGVPGIGDKNARRLLATSGPVASLWDDPEALDRLDLPEAPLLSERLHMGRDAYNLGRELATLLDDVPLALEEDGLAYHGIDRAAIGSLCDRFGFDQLRDRILTLATQEHDVEARRPG
jgi:5'-3' exonuclease